MEPVEAEPVQWVDGFNHRLPEPTWKHPTG